MIYYDQDNIVVRTSVKEDIDGLKDRLRFEDVQEIKASHNHTPEEALYISLSQSMVCLTVENDGLPVAMFGINPESVWKNEAIVWLLSSPEFHKLRIRFLKHSRRFIKVFLEYYPLLYNFVDCRNTPSIKWLKFCGAQFGDKIILSGVPFQYFKFERKQICAIPQVELPQSLQSAPR